MQNPENNPRPAWLPAALDAVGRHQFLTGRQVAALAAVDQAEVRPTLEGLVAEKILVRLQPTRGLDGAPPGPAFALTRRGAALVAGATGRPAPRVPNPGKSLYMLAHDLGRNEIGIVLEILDRSGRLRLLRWETARTRIGASVQLPLRGRALRVPLVADALAIVEVAGKTDALLVEIDMGTVSLPRMRTKYAAYLAWWREGGPERRFGQKALRVLTIAPNEKRLYRLREAALAATDGRGSGLFWFGEQKLVDAGRPPLLLGPGWRSGTYPSEQRAASPLW